LHQLGGDCIRVKEEQRIVKLLFDFLPIILFFIAFKVADANKEAAAALATSHLGFLVSGGIVGPGEAPVLLATVVVIVATLAQVALLAARGKKIDLMLWVSLGLVVVMGGLTIWLHSETFIKWKPTLLYWVMATAFALGPLLFGKNLLKLLLGEQLQLPEPVWQRLNGAWIAFFASMGALNLWVAYTFATDTWVNFKLFGGIGLMLVFTVAQGLYLARHLPDEAAAPKSKELPP
jgi:intracellular septation protein